MSDAQHQSAPEDGQACQLGRSISHAALDAFTDAMPKLKNPQDCVLMASVILTDVAAMFAGAFAAANGMRADQVDPLRLPAEYLGMVAAQRDAARDTPLEPSPSPQP